MTPTLRAALDAWRALDKRQRGSIYDLIESSGGDPPGCECDICAADRAALALLRAAGETGDKGREG